MNQIKTLVVKIGSSLLVDENSGKLRMDFLYHLMNDIAFYKERGLNIVIVSSGSVALGRRFGQVDHTQILTLSQKQAAAAYGQPVLMAAYQNFANEHQLRTPQILITLHDFEDRKRFLNAEDTLEELLRQGSIPIVNENDTVATKHLRVGDNDRLSAKVAQLVEADALIILTNVEGLLDENKQVVRHVEELNDDILNLAGGASGVGTGGMVTKLQAAKIASASGCVTHIISGHSQTPIQDAFNSSHIHTTISSDITPESARKLWISTSLDIQGEIYITPQALQRIVANEDSLYPHDIVKVSGDFSRGDTVSILCDEKECGLGICSFYMYEVTALMETQAPDVFAVLGYNTHSDIIQKNDLALF